MRTKRKLPDIEPFDFHKTRRDRKCIRKASGRVEVQGFGLAANGDLVFAGVHWCAEVSSKWAWRICAHWRRWRRWYDNLPWNKNLSYPAKTSPPVAFVGIHPIGNPQAIVWVKVA